jgi:hypothetical protein
MIFEGLVCPRKARKTQNKLMCCIDGVISTLSEGIQHFVEVNRVWSLNMFAFFVPFVDKLPFFG